MGEGAAGAARRWGEFCGRLTRDLALTGKAAGRYPDILAIETLRDFRDGMAARLRQLEAGSP